ncbi:hypothetical protein N802_18310 [Knoellia sinensis KCTC 19936]|uniref:Uncharacterized protein n=1 Tax=Knoellia sinensis KCTC 19936 TaxID=1385520 RepID=A0A0A0J523_9MICO|nr:hypothetical protein [Knoellia sinensis]KGN32318.1 hypothetical protein N802_18310 [Knoellia sinensis KCTC 19936]
MRTPVPGDPGSLAAAGAVARRAGRDLVAARKRSATAYTSLKAVWGTSTSVRTRKEGTRSLAALAEGARHADAVGAVLQGYAVELSELQTRARRLVESVAAAGLTVEGERIGLGWGVTGEADAAAAREREGVRAALQQELDALLAQHRRRRDRLLAEVAGSTHDLERLARELRLG